MGRNLRTMERAAAVAAGATLVGVALRGRQPLLAGAAGVALMAGGVAGYLPGRDMLGAGMLGGGDTRRALSGPRGNSIKTAVTIAWPQDELFKFWRALDNLPLFVRGLEQVERLQDGTTRWTFRGPGGVPLHWRAEIINEVEPELIAWRSLPGADVVSAGSVHFRRLRRGGTEVSVSMQYSPPGGKAGAAVGWLAGRAPASEVREDLRRLKQLFETGEIPTAGPQPSGTRSAMFSAVKRTAS